MANRLEHSLYRIFVSYAHEGRGRASYPMVLQEHLAACLPPRLDYGGDLYLSLGEESMGPRGLIVRKIKLVHLFLWFTTASLLAGKYCRKELDLVLGEMQDGHLNIEAVGLR